MAKGATIGCKRKTRNNVRLEKNGSDESDEDNKVIEDEEVDEPEDEYCSSLVGDESEESLGKHIDDKKDEEDEGIILKVEKVGRPTTSKGRRQVKKKNNKIEDVGKPKKMSRVSRAKTSRKGKEKVSDMKIEVAKQVCGICLSEEGKRTIRGVLNCCSHYFCFACIMEWSKVESRCPSCKQRFASINKKVRSDGRRDAVFKIPERDQVYEPSEEELMGYLDPYDGVLCTECHLDGDDALMLLCDICDSPSHTYCVGLGLDVPEGNWYCYGCRPAVDISSNQQTLNPTLDHGLDHGTADILAVNSSPIPTSRGTFDLDEANVPDTPATQVPGFSQSPRTSIGDPQSSSSFPSGHAVLTLSERRQIQRLIQQFLTRRSERNESPAHASGISLFGSWISPTRTVITQPNVVVNPIIMHQNINVDRTLEYVTSSFCGREASSLSRQSDLRGQALCNEASASADRSYGGGLVAQQSNFLGFNATSGGGAFVHHQLHPCIGRSSNNGTDVSISTHGVREGTLPSRSSQGPVYAHHF